MATGSSASVIPFNRRVGDRARLKSVALLTFVPAVLYAIYFADASSFPTTYALARTSRANDTIIILSPYVALSSAWEMLTVRRLWGIVSLGRPFWQVVTARLQLTLVTGLVSLFLCYVLFLGGRQIPANGVAFLAISIASILAWTLFGAALSLVVGPTVSLPLSALIPFLAISFPQSQGPLWVRHLTGYLSDCCSSSQVLDRRAVVGSLVALSLLTVISSSVILLRLAPSPRVARQRLAVGGLATVLAMISGALVAAPVADMGPLPTVTRPERELTCRAEVCLWPETTNFFVSNRKSLRVVENGWQHLGLELPMKRRVAPVETSSALGLAVASTNRTEVLSSMISLYPRAVSGCADKYATQSADTALDQLSYLLALEVGVSPAAARSSYLLLATEPTPVRTQSATLLRISRGCK